MIAESKRIEFWNFLVTEKNQARPKGITIQRLAVVKPVLIGLDELWIKVIEQHGASDRSAAEFYRSNEPAAILSRTAFWDGVRSIIRQDENKRSQRNQSQTTKTGFRPKRTSRNRR